MITAGCMYISRPRVILWLDRVKKPLPQHGSDPGLQTASCVLGVLPCVRTASHVRALHAFRACIRTCCAQRLYVELCVHGAQMPAYLSDPS